MIPDSPRTAHSPGLRKYRRRLLSGLPVEERRLVLAGIPTMILEGGDGPPLVLLHGPGEFAAVWMRVIPNLARTHRIIVPDLPGHGASDMPEDALDSKRMTSWLNALVDAACPSPPDLVGHLLGGAVAARFACEKPDRARSLVLVDSYGLAPLRPAPRFALAMIGFVALPNERTQDRLFRQCFADIDGVRDGMGNTWDSMSAYALECARTPNLKAALRQLMPRFALSAIPHEMLARLSTPTTLIWGRHDLQVRLQIAETASTRYGWPLHVIEDAGDDPAVEQPEAFLDALHTSLEKTPAAPPPAMERA